MVRRVTVRMSVSAPGSQPRVTFGCLARTRLLVMIMLVGTVLLASTQPVHASVTQEQQFLSLVNQERTSRGLAPLTPQPVVTETLSRPWSLKMAAAGRLEHSGSGDQIFDAVAALFPTIISVGENVGYSASVDQLHRALMDSPVHRSNLLSEKFRHIGLGVAQIGSTVWVTQTFFTLAASNAAPVAAAAPPPAAPVRAPVTSPVAAPVKPPVAAPATSPAQPPMKAAPVAKPSTVTISQPVPVTAAPPPPPVPAIAAAQAIVTEPPRASPSPAPSGLPLDVASTQLVRRPVTTAPAVAAGLLLALGLAVHLRLSLSPAGSTRRSSRR